MTKQNRVYFQSVQGDFLIKEAMEKLTQTYEIDQLTVDKNNQTPNLKRKQNCRKYVELNLNQKLDFITDIANNKYKSIIMTAKHHGINYSNAKAILKKIRKEGKIGIKKQNQANKKIESNYPDKYYHSSIILQQPNNKTTAQQPDFKKLIQKYQSSYKKIKKPETNINPDNEYYIQNQVINSDIIEKQMQMQYPQKKQKINSEIHYPYQQPLQQQYHQDQFQNFKIPQNQSEQKNILIYQKRKIPVFNKNCQNQRIQNQQINQKTLDNQNKILISQQHTHNFQIGNIQNNLIIAQKNLQYLICLVEIINKLSMNSDNQINLQFQKFFKSQLQSIIKFMLEDISLYRKSYQNKQENDQVVMINSNQLNQSFKNQDENTVEILKEIITQQITCDTNHQNNQKNVLKNNEQLLKELIKLFH